MSSPSKGNRARRQTTDPELRQADTDAGTILAADADTTTPINNPNWKERALGAPLTDALAQRPTMRWNQVRMGAELAALCARTARDNNMSREGWMRQVLAEKISTIHGIPVDVLLVGMKPSRPRRTRHDGL